MFNAKDRTIYKVLHGSHAYGTAVETSDKDYKGVAVPPLSYYLGYLNHFEQAEKYESRGADCDEVIYDLRKFFKLASDCNPNIIEVLFVDDEHVIQMTDAGRALRDRRDLFLSAKTRHTFAGYAHAQLKRIKNHKAFLLSPPTHKPTREEYGLSNSHKAISPSEFGAYNELINKGEKLSDNVMEILAKEKKYIKALTHWNQYQNWVATRNKARAGLEAKFGYDTKHAGHLVRLLRMCQEILEGKGVIVKRPDAEELLSVRNGAWTYDQVIEFAEAADTKCEELYKKLKETPAEDRAVPMEPDRKLLDDLCIGISCWELSSELKDIIPTFEMSIDDHLIDC